MAIFSFLKGPVFKVEQLSSLKKEFYRQMENHPMKVPALVARLKSILTPSDFDAIMASTALTQNDKERVALRAYASYLSNLNQSLGNLVAVRATDPQALSISDWVNIHNALNEQYANHILSQSHTSDTASVTEDISALKEIVNTSVRSLNMSNFYELNIKKFKTWYKYPVVSSFHLVEKIKNQNIRGITGFSVMLGWAVGLLINGVTAGSSLIPLGAIAVPITLLLVLAQLLAVVYECASFSAASSEYDFIIDNDTFKNKSWKDVLGGEDLEATIVKGYIAHLLQQKLGALVVAFAIAHYTPKEALALFDSFLDESSKEQSSIKETVEQWAYTSMNHGAWDSIQQSFDIKNTIEMVKAPMAEHQLEPQTSHQ